MNELVGRLHLSDAIANAEARNARRAMRKLQDKASDARDSAAGFIADHPFAAVVGGIALGVLIGTMLPRRPAPASDSSSAISSASAGLRKLARQAMELGIAQGRDILAATAQARSKGQEATEELGERIADNARDIAKKAGRSGRDIKERLGL